MAEKEERIYIEYFKDDPCKNCDVAEVGYCVNEDKGYGCLYKSNYIYGISRQEAIEKMAKALYLYNRDDKWYEENSHIFSKYMNGMAEAALNALLEK